MVMDRWARLFLGHLSAAEVSIYMLKRYVDNINTIVAILEEGWFWQRSTDKKVQLVWTQERERLNQTEGKSA